jgi:alpha-1,3-rhamnosyl/mannosyltransferase
MASWSGVGRYTTGLVRALAARDDVQIVQVCAAGTDLPVAVGPRAEAVFAEQGPLSVRGALELGRLATRAQPDLVHCLHFPTPLPLPANCPLVVTLHDLTPLVAPGAMPSLIKRAVYRRYNARAARVADRLIVPSQATAATVGRLFPGARRKLVLTAEAADDFSSGSAGPLSPRLAALTSTPYLLAMGNTKAHKDVPTLLRAFARLGSAGANVGLLLVGAEVPGYAEAVLAGAPAGVRGRVAFTGHVSDAELRALYAGARAFVCPSRHEGFGLPPLEAMALGAPVVCVAAASLPEVVGDAAVLVPAGNAEALAASLRSVLGDEVLRQRLRQAGRERAAQFTWQRTAAATVAVYDEALAHFRARRA